MNEDITLELEGSTITCKKDVLIKNSEYFSAMFSGNFLESEQKSVKIRGVDMIHMNIVLMLLWDHTSLVKEEDLLPVLQAALMLQFTKIIEITEKQILETLKPSNCLRVWTTLDQQITPLDLKAKCMALEEFPVIAETDQILDLKLDQICLYLGNTKLKVENEFSVFQTLMKWWYDNSKNYESSEYTDILIRLLHCVNFKDVTKENLNEIKTYPDICDNGEIVSLLTCISYVKEDGHLAQFSQKHQDCAMKFIYESRDRVCLELLCIILEPFSKFLSGNEKTIEKYLNKNVKGSVIFKDKFGRKRKKVAVTSEEETQSLTCDDMLAVLFDPSTKTSEQFFKIPENKCEGLIGFEILPYKEFILLFGGEFSLGSGTWNTNLWMYDSFREKWDRRTVMPYYRRHFETCIAGNSLYLVGGVGRFRVVQDNMFYYNIKMDDWSTTIPLPCNSRQIKCCNYDDKLFILNLRESCGYIFNDNAFKAFTTVPICWGDFSKDEILSKLDEYAVFFWKGDLYVVEKCVLKFQFTNNRLILVRSQNYLEHFSVFGKAVICNDTLYTFYSHDGLFVSTFNLKTLEAGNRFSLDLKTLFNADKEAVTKEKIYPVSRVCSFHHYDSIKIDDLVNDFCW